VLPLSAVRFALMPVAVEGGRAAAPAADRVLADVGAAAEAAVGAPGKAPTGDLAIRPTSLNN
jgi:hypothetical protein